MDFILNVWYDRNEFEHQKDDENVTTVKDRERIQEGIPIQDLHIYKKLHICGLEISTLTNLYMLEQQLLILKRSSVHCIQNERATRLPVDNG
jgi:hypothetical protein